jgi:branched-chain amino acid transport system ATP-binding protein
VSLVAPLLGRVRGQAALIAGFLVLVAVLPQFSSTFFVTVLMISLIWAILAMSLDILMGYTGLESLGQAAFFGIGAYTVGLGTSKYGLGWGAAVILALVFGTLAAAVVGPIAVRFRGLFFLVITLAFAQMLWGIANRWVELTNGYPGVRDINRPFDGLEKDVNYYYFVLVVLVITAFLMWRVVQSPFGLTLRGIRDSESRMRTSGYNVWLHKYIAFMICALFAAVAGALYTYAIQFVSTDVLALNTSFEPMLMVILGGVGTLMGPVIGAASIIFLRYYLSGDLMHWIILLGAIYIATVLFAPNGIVGLARSGLKRLRTSEEDGESEADAADAELATQITFPAARAAGRAPVDESLAGTPALTVAGVSRSFGAIAAVQDVSFTANVGARMAVIGPNGAGKTTLFNLISGVYRPAAGDISLFEQRVTRLAPHARVRMGLGRTYQVTNLYPTLTVMDNIRLGILGLQPSKYALHSRSAGLAHVNERGKELLDVVGLWARRDLEVQHLAYGHQRQLEIVMALASEPKVLLLDEPAAGLSVAETKPMIQLIKSLDPMLALLIIEHDMDFAFELANEVVVLHNGQMLAQGSNDEIKANTTVRDVYLGKTFV